MEDIMGFIFWIFDAAFHSKQCPRWFVLLLLIIMIAVIGFIIFVLTTIGLHTVHRGELIEGYTMLAVATLFIIGLVWKLFSVYNTYTRLHNNEDAS